MRRHAVLSGLYILVRGWLASSSSDSDRAEFRSVFWKAYVASMILHVHGLVFAVALSGAGALWVSFQSSRLRHLPSASTTPVVNVSLCHSESRSCHGLQQK